MGSAKDIQMGRGAEALYKELLEMRERIMQIRADFAAIYGPDGELTRLHDRHLLELADMVDWKLHILTMGSPVGVRGAGEVADTVVSVSQLDVSGPDFSGGYIGG